MKTLLFSMLTVVLLATGACSSGPEEVESAHAVLYDRDGEPVGTASLTETQGGVRIQANVSDLPPGEYDLQLHEYGQCSPPGFFSAGGPYPPPVETGMVENVNPALLEELASFEVGEDGAGQATAVAPVVTLKPGENSLFHPGGTALILKEGAAPGAEGVRVACGVVSRVDPEEEDVPPGMELDSAKQAEQTGTPPDKRYRQPAPE